MSQLLQGHVRFAMNTTVGVADLFDPAEKVGLQRRNADFGQTFAAWGWDSSRYLVVPLLGPRTVRDALGELAGSPLAPLGYVDNGTVAWGLRAVQVANGRTQLFPLEGFRADALDDYLFVRDAWTQRRNSQIRDKELLKE